MEEDIVVRYEKFGYKRGPCIEYDEKRSKELDCKCYRIQDISEIKSHLQVRVAKFDSLIMSNDGLYYLLPCIRRPLALSCYNDGTIVSVRWKIKGRVLCKGLPGGTFVVPFVTVIMKGRPICVRLYKKKIHTTGKLSAKNNEKLIGYCRKYLTETNQFWTEIQTKRELFMDAVEWLADVSRTNSVSFPNPSYGGQIDYDLLFVSSCPEKYHYFITQIIDRFGDVSSVLELYQRCDEIIDLEGPPCEYESQLKAIQTCQMRYIYNLGIEIDVQNFVQYLYEMGYFITHYDDTKRNPTIKILDRNEYDDDYMIRRQNSDYVHTVSFSRRGTIQHSGTGHKRHEEIYKKLMKDIILYDP